MHDGAQFTIRLVTGVAGGKTLAHNDWERMGMPGLYGRGWNLSSAIASSGC